MTHEELIAKLTEMLGIQTKLTETAVDMLKPAIEAEREACADLCEQYGFNNHCGITTDVIATEIRARGQV